MSLSRIIEIRQVGLDNLEGRPHIFIVGQTCWCMPGCYYSPVIVNPKYVKPQGRYFFYETPWPEDYKTAYSRSIICENPLFPPRELLLALHLNSDPGRIFSVEVVSPDDWGYTIDEKLITLRRRFSRSQSPAMVDLIEEIMELRDKQRTQEIV